MIDIQVNKKLFAKLDKMEETLDDELEDKLFAIANDAVRFTLGSNRKGKPAVRTGAYLASFSFGVGAGRPRSKHSHHYRDSNPAATALAGLTADIKRADLKNTTRITLRNGSSYANNVEYGWSGGTSGYYIFAKLRRLHG